MSNLACSRRLWRWVSFSKMLSSLILVVVSISRNKSFSCALLCNARPSSVPLNDETMKRGGDDQSCGGKLVPPECLRKWKPRWGHAFLSTLLSLYLWRTLLGHRLIQNRILLSFWKVFVVLLTCVFDTERVQFFKESFRDMIYAPRIDNFNSFTAG